MAKYVQYTPDVFAVQDGGVHVWWFPQSFSQSQLGDRLIGSNACTLIATLLAGKLDEFKISIWGFFDQPLSRMLVTCIAEAIIEGNEIHETLLLRGELYDVDLTVPEALNAITFKYPCLAEWLEKTTIVAEPMDTTLAKHMKSIITSFEQTPPPLKRNDSDLYIILVTAGRSVLFCYQGATSKVTLIDSHAHVFCQSGAVVAQVRVGDLTSLCAWFTTMCTQSFSNWTSSSPMPYELAALYVRE